MMTDPGILALLIVAGLLGFSLGIWIEHRMQQSEREQELPKE